MDWQQPIALGIVVLTAALFVLARIRRKRRSGLPCGSNCGCSGASSSNAPSVIYHAHKGKRPEIILKMK